MFWKSLYYFLGIISKNSIRKNIFMCYVQFCYILLKNVLKKTIFLYFEQVYIIF